MILKDQKSFHLFFKNFQESKYNTNSEILDKKQCENSIIDLKKKNSRENTLENDLKSSVLSIKEEKLITNKKKKKVYQTMKNFKYSKIKPSLNKNIQNKNTFENPKLLTTNKCK